MPKPILERLIDRPINPVTFLIIDDDTYSVMAMKRTMKKLKIANPIVVAKDGVEALEILLSDNPETGLTMPYILTLDLNMPRMDGFELLDRIRDNPKLAKTVVFVLSTSDAPKDISAAYDKNIAGYIVKDDLRNSFEKALKMIDSYASIVELPFD